MPPAMDDKTLTMLEWPRLRALLADRAATLAGRDRCGELAIHRDLEAVRHAQRLTTEARELLRDAESFPLGGIHDLRGPLRRLDQGAVLEGDALRAIADTAEAARRLKSFLASHDEEFPALAELGVPIVPLPRLVEAIRRCFDETGEVADAASAELAEIRRKLGASQGEIRSRLQRMLRTHADSLQEALITMRGERFVLPVRADAKSQVPGVVHDQSSSGMTLFIEPMAILDLNNQVARLKLSERDEIARILAMLTGLVREHGEELHWTIDALTEIDFTHAKARLSRDLDGTSPKLETDGTTLLYGARHPLLVARRLQDPQAPRVVPIDLALDDRHQILIITGPNTGGKTVSLKTLGLVTLMTQAGLHPPVDPGTRIAIFRQVFADIGDEQSLQQNLSTFSGHMKNLVRILQAADGRTLVLLDELGAGTDPQEGAALARAIIDELMRRDARLVATTHYGELKLLAYQRAGIANASAEFDLKTLSPTYRLLMGVPGQSNAITIAAALGLPPKVAAEARAYLKGGRDDAAQVIERLESEQHAAIVARSEADRKLAEAERLRSEYEAKLATWSQERKELREQARQALAQELEAARSEIASVTRELQSQHSAPIAQKAHDRLAKLKHRMLKPERAASTLQGKQLLVGERVFVPRLNQHAVVQAPPTEAGEVLLQIGIMKITAKLHELQPEGAQSDREGRRSRELQPFRARQTIQAERQPGMELDLRGWMVHEALGEIEGFLDAAVRADLKQVQLIHGGGTGALRKGVRDYLRTSPYVAAFRPGEQGEGGDGVTVVQLR